MDSVSSPFLSAKLHAVTPAVMTLYREPNLLVSSGIYGVLCTIYGSLRRKFINTTKCGRAKCTHRFVFHSRRTLPRCKFIQFQSHEYLHLSLTTLRIHLAGKIGKINNNDDARYGALSSFRKERATGLKLNKFSVVGGIVRNFCTHPPSPARRKCREGESVG